MKCGEKPGHRPALRVKVIDRSGEPARPFKIMRGKSRGRRDQIGRPFVMHKAERFRTIMEFRPRQYGETENFQIVRIPRDGIIEGSLESLEIISGKAVHEVHPEHDTRGIEPGYTGSELLEVYRPVNQGKGGFIHGLKPDLQGAGNTRKGLRKILVNELGPYFKIEMNVGSFLFNEREKGQRAFFRSVVSGIQNKYPFDTLLREILQFFLEPGKGNFPNRFFSAGFIAVGTGKGTAAGKLPERAPAVPYNRNGIEGSVEPGRRQCRKRHRYPSRRKRRRSVEPGIHEQAVRFFPFSGYTSQKQPVFPRKR